MKKLSTKIIITLAALMLSAVQSYASETCAADVNTCTPKQLCEASTSMMNNNKVWSVDPAYVEHVAMSKQLGINCGVVDVVAPTCETDAGLCAVSALCEQATVSSGSAKAWSDAVGKAGHVSLAKEYGLACDVLVAVDNSQNYPCGYRSPSDDPTTCNNTSLCDSATFTGNGGDLLWVKLVEYMPFVKEAKKRGLTCGVGEGVETKTNDYVCGLATYGGQLKYWHKGGSLWIDEAKKRGLTCGVGSTSTDNYADTFKSQSLLKRQQLQYALKKLGFYSSSIDGLWGKGTSSAIVKYALTNGVGSYSPSNLFSIILMQVAVPSSFAAPKPKVVAKPKVKVQDSNAYGLVAIISNPSVPASQAWAICDPQGDIAAGQAGAAYKAPSYGYSGSCNSYGSFANCNATPNSGGFAGGFAEGLARGITARKARKSALKSCLAQYGYRQ